MSGAMARDRSRSRSPSSCAALTGLMERVIDGGFALGEAHGRRIAALEHAMETSRLRDEHAAATAALEARYANFARAVGDGSPASLEPLRRELRLAMEANVIVDCWPAKANQVLCRAADSALRR
jgi:hypothetical protein